MTEADIRVLPPLSEWTEKTHPGVELSPAGRRFAAHLVAEGEPRIYVDELRDGLRVCARSWVGVVRLDSVEIRVIPKLAGNHLGLVRLLEFVSGLEGLWRPGGQASLRIVGDSLFDLVCLLFAEACEGVIRRGLLTDYVEHEDALAMVRGRILPDRQVLKRFGQLDRVHCRFDELEYDVDENRLLTAALRAISPRVRSPFLHRRVARLRAILEPLCDPTQLDLRMRGSITYNRLNTHYRRAHHLANLLLKGMGVDDIVTAGADQSFAFLLDMNPLFEQFVTKLVRRVLPAPEYRVRAQVAERSIVWDTGAQRPYGKVIPDLLVEWRDARLPIDAKYKLYDERHLDPGDVYQLFLYAYALGILPEGRAPAAVVLYPSSGPARPPLQLRIQRLGGREGADILSLGIPIPAALDELRAQADGPFCRALRSRIAEFLGLTAARQDELRNI